MAADPFAQYAVGSKDDPFAAFSVSKPGEAAPMTRGVLGHPLSASDETPTLTNRVVNSAADNPLIQGAAHPQSLGDAMSLLLPDMGAAVKVAAKAAQPVVAPIGRGVIRTVAGVGDMVDPDLVGVMSPRGAKVIKIAQRARAAMDIPPRSLDSTARVLEPAVDAAEAVPRPVDPNAAHLDLSTQMRPSEMTAQQLAERVQYGHGAPAKPTGRIVTRGVEPMPSHAPTVETGKVIDMPRKGVGTKADKFADIPDDPAMADIVDRMAGGADMPTPGNGTMPSELQQPRVDIGAERVGRANGLSTEQVRQQTAPILGEAPGQASPILPQHALNNIIDAMKALPREGGAREAYVRAATSGKAQWQIENIRRTLEHLGLLIPAAATVAPSVRDMLLQRMRAGVTGASPTPSQ